MKTQSLIFWVVLVGSLYSITFSDDDIFPFSNYPMYSAIFAPQESTPFFTVFAEYEDGSVGRFDSRVRVSLGESPFWSAAFREALLVNRDPRVIEKKLKAVLSWHQRVAREAPLKKDQTAKILRLQRNDILWSEFVARRLRNESVRPLFETNTQVLFEAR